MQRFFYYLLGVSLLLGPLTAGAQEIPGVGNPILLETIPTSPEPHQQVTVRAKSFSLDFNRATLTWRVDGVTALSGKGETEITFETGPIGTATQVGITAADAKGIFSRSLTIRPAVVDLLWQANTYTPPLYRGKALPGSEASLRVVAVPQIVIAGRQIPPDELIYTWKIGSRVLGNSSGVGRNSIEVTGPAIFGTAPIRVVVETADRSLEVLGFADIKAVQPTILFYENDPLLGIRYERAVTDMFSLVNDEVMITAHPFFFSGTKRTGEQSEFRWELNGVSVENPLADQSSIVLRQTGNVGGVATVSLSIQNLEEILQRARNSFRITFGGIQN